MIFVTVGSSMLPFDRLLRSLDGSASEPLVVQHGVSNVRPSGARCVDFMSFEDVVRHVREARLVVCHAGVGSVLVALQNGTRPIVVPRLRAFGEAPDDHQDELASRLAAEALVTVVRDPGDLAEFFRAGDARAIDERQVGRALVAELSRELDALLGSGRP